MKSDKLIRTVRGTLNFRKIQLREIGNDLEECARFEFFTFAFELFMFSGLVYLGVLGRLLWILLYRSGFSDFSGLVSTPGDNITPKRR